MNELPLPEDFRIIDKGDRMFLSKGHDLTEEEVTFCARLDDAMHTAIKQAKQDSRHLNESDIQSLYSVLLEFLVYALGLPMSTLDCRASPHLLVELNGVLVSGFTDVVNAYQLAPHVDASALLHELKLPYKRGVGKKAGSDIMGSLSRFHLAHLFYEMLGMIGRETSGRPHHLKDVQESGIRLYGSFQVQ